MITETVELSAGPVAYFDSGGNGVPLVLLHGLLMDASLWDQVIADLRDDYRCVAPTLPLGAHSHPMRADADLSLPGIARLTGELLEHLDLHDVILVGNDTGGALVQLLLCEDTTRIGKVVLASCDAFDNFPPGLTGKALVTSGRLPPALFGLFMQQMRVKPVRRLPIAFGWLTKRGDAVTARWVRQLLRQPQVRRDTVRVLRAISADRTLMTEAAKCLPAFDRPALVAWAKQDRVMPPEHGRRPAGLLPKATLVEITDSYSLLPLDQPAALAAAIRDFAKT